MATVEELRQSLGETAQEPMIALQLQELERVEFIKAEIYSCLESGYDSDNAAEYAKYNQRHNDTMKTLMAMLKLKAKSAPSAKPESPFTDEQKYLLGDAANADKGEGTKKKAKG